MFLRPLFFLLCFPVMPSTNGSNQSSDEKTSQPPSSPPAGRKPKNSIPSSGVFSTKVSHDCTWHTSGSRVVNLLISCNYVEQTYWCRYSGQPNLCQSYNNRRAKVRYWKQLIGKLKKRRNACDGEKVLTTGTCKDLITSHMYRKEKGEGRGNKDPDFEMKQEKNQGRTHLLEEREEEELNDIKLEGNYCAAVWHPVCSFFVRFLQV